MGRRFAGYLALSVSLVSASEIGCDSAERPKPETSAGDLGPGGPRATEFARRFAAMRQAAQRVQGAARACPDDAIQKKLGSGAGRLLVAEAGALARFESRPQAVAPADPHFEFLTTPALRAIAAPAVLESRKAATDAAYRILELEKEYEYVAIVRPTKRQPPHFNGDRFVAGQFEAWVVVFDLAGAEPLCATQVFATSSEEVAARDGTPKDAALWNDFVMQVRRSLDEAVGQMSRHLRLDLG